jgi:hypothetical protein
MPSDESEQAMIDLSFYAALPYGALYRESQIHPGVWAWAPRYCLLVHPDSSEHNSQLTGADWLPIGALDNKTLENVSVLFSQLGQVRLLGTPEQGQAWIPRAEYDHLARTPVLLAFTLASAEGQKDKLYVSRTVPPANLGEIGMVLVGEGDQVDFKYLRIGYLSRKSQKLQQSMGAALSRLEQRRNPERSDWLAQWKEIQQMAQQLAADYWRAHQDSQVEPPPPINIWKLRQGVAALAAMTMVQGGAHTSIHNKDQWEREHMIQDGRYQGLVVSRYIHKTEHTVNEYWIEPPKDPDASPDPDAPVDLDLVSQEVLRQQAKLDDLEADLVTLTPIYLLAMGEDEVYLSPEQLLKDLGFTPKRNQAGYGNQYHPDEVQRIIDAFERLAWLKIKTHQSIQKSKGRKPALIIDEAPFLAVMGRRWQAPLDGFGPRRFLGWKYRIPWLKTFTGDTEAGKQLGILLKKSFQFSQRQRWEKRLARYLTIHLCVAAHHHKKRINCINRHVLEECGLMPTDRDRARPAEYVAQFKKAMDNLKEARIIGDWMSTLDEKMLPPRAWLDLWLDSSFWVTQSPIAMEAGYQKMIDTRKPKASERA